MKKLLLAINIAAAALLGLAGIYVVPKAIAQCTGIFPPNTVCGNLGATAAPPAAFTANTSVFGPGTTTSGDVVTFGNTAGTQLSDPTSISTNQQITLIGSLFTTGTTSLFNTSVTSFSITSTFVYSGFTITFPESGSAALVGAGNTFTKANSFSGNIVFTGNNSSSGNNTFSGNNNFSGTTSFTGPLVATSSVSRTTAVKCLRWNWL